MIRFVTVTNYKGETLRLNLMDPSESGLEVLDMTGLGPVRATINTSKISTQDGVIYNSATADGRNILLKLGFLASPTIEEARQRTYRYFPLKRRVDLLIESDTRTVHTYGMVESNEPLIFSKETETTVSIVCPDSYFLDAGPNGKTVAEFFALTGGLEFPIESDLYSGPDIEFGNLVSNFDRIIDYPGDTEVGLTIRMRATGSVTTPVIFDPNTNDAIRIDSTVVAVLAAPGIVEGDEIVIRTGVGQKSAYLIRNGNRINILNALGRDVDWLHYSRGLNPISYRATAGAANLQVTVESDILYEGI